MPFLLHLRSNIIPIQKAKGYNLLPIITQPLPELLRYVGMEPIASVEAGEGLVHIMAGWPGGYRAYLLYDRFQN